MGGPPAVAEGRSENESDRSNRRAVRDDGLIMCRRPGQPQFALSSTA
jgi:hypothetical protein